MRLVAESGKRYRLLQLAALGNRVLIPRPHLMAVSVKFRRHHLTSSFFSLRQ